MNRHAPQRNIQACAHLALSLVLLLVTAACPPRGPRGQINNRVLASDLNGEANNADPALPQQQYRAPAALTATDGGTTAASDAVLFNRVGGNVNAIPGQNPNEDAAVAKTNNRVVSEFVVNRQDAFTFNTDYAIQGIRLTGDGDITIRVSANVLDANGQVIRDANGQPVPNTQLAFVDLVIQQDAQGNPQVIIGGDTANPDQLDAGGSYTRRISGPNQGVQLPAANYRIELELRVYATAPVTPASRAKVDRATASIVLR